MYDHYAYTPHARWRLVHFLCHDFISLFFFRSVRSFMCINLDTKVNVQLYMSWSVLSSTLDTKILKILVSVMLWLLFSHWQQLNFVKLLASFDLPVVMFSMNSVFFIGEMTFGSSKSGILGIYMLCFFSYY